MEKEEIKTYKNAMKAFEKSFMNNWNRHHLPFIAFAEFGALSKSNFNFL